MCGISGYISKTKPVAALNIIKMNEAIRHRGPDDEGFVCLIDQDLKSYSSQDSAPAIKALYPSIDPKLSSRLALGFRRLSILELSEKGHQPMLDVDVCICFNGEIYNYKAIKSKLQLLGCTFNSASDTEVILRAYQTWGIDMTKELNGMFAISIVDLKLRKIFLIRDRMGLKPLFYFKDEQHIAWCSEMKGLLKADWIHPEMNMEGLLLNYQFKSSVAPHTCFENIFALPPAHIMSISMDNLHCTQEQYWHIPTRESKLDCSLAEAADLLEQKLSDITALQLQADVPLISMMSGGIDSTLITALAHQHQKDIAAYTLSIDGTGEGYDELPQAQKMAAKLGIQHYIQQITDDDILEDAFEHLAHVEEPYNSLDVIFNASKYLSNAGFKVILTGNGADELFGGYTYNLNIAKWKKLRNYSFMAGLLPKNGSLQRLKYYLSLKNIGQYFLSTTGGLRDYQLSELLPDKSLKSIKQLTQPLLSRTDFDSDYEGLFYYDLKYSAAAHHTFHDDISAMRYSVEMRYPFLDHELIELVAQLPLSYRYDGVSTKPLLRTVAEKYIAKENLSMRKKGFSLPQDKVLASNKALQNFVDKEITFLKSTGIFDNKMIDKIVSEGRQKQYSLYIWQLVSTAVWMKTYF